MDPNAALWQDDGDSGEQDQDAVGPDAVVSHGEIVDDLVVLGEGGNLDELEHNASRTVAIVKEQAARFGVRLNWEPGKSELLFGVYGEGQQ
eukprot:10519283-Lingulodinium_polyedra.AAC.1